MTPADSRGAVCSPHAEATAAGYRALEAGGSAVDAALAAAAMLTVVYPHQCGVGGDAIALVGTPGGTVRVVNGSGRSAAVLDPGTYDAGDGHPPTTGAKSVTVPGVLSVWQTLAERWGALPLAHALAEPAAVARAGFPIAPGLHRDLEREQANLAADDGAREVFFRDGRVLTEGETLALPRLADTLGAVAEHGVGVVYDGEIGASLTARLKELGGDLTAGDFAEHEVTVEDPVSMRFGGEDYLSSAGNSQGTFFLRGLAALAADGDVPDPLGPSAAHVARVLALTATERDLLLADPGQSAYTPAELLDAGSIADLAAAVRSPEPAGSLITARRTHPRRSGDTVAIVATDAAGTWVSLIQSAFHAFGSCVLDPATGVLLHNRGASFSLDPASPNHLGPRKRPAHTLMPVLVRRGGILVGAHGTMGGRAQPQIHTHLALALARGLDPHAAVSRPRWVIGQLTAGPSARDDVITISAERAVPEAARRSLTAHGFRTRTLADLEDDCGHLQVIRRAPASGELLTGSDPRADGNRRSP